MQTRETVWDNSNVYVSPSRKREFTSVLSDSDISFPTVGGERIIFERMSVKKIPFKQFLFV